MPPEGSVVVYRLPPDEEELGSGGLAVVWSSDELQPLCTWDDKERTFVTNPDYGTVPAEGNILRVLDDVYPSFRQMPRPHNPHGEESEETWTIGDEEDISGVAIIVNEERGPSFE